MSKFVNPYNFIPFEERKNTERISREQSYRSGEKLKSGWMDVKVYVKRPLIIPDGAHPKYIDINTGEIHENPSSPSEYHKEYDFASKGEGDNKEYYIPGSELRGMLRSMYEAVTDSCVKRLKDDKSISQRLPLYSSINKRGLLEYNTSSKSWVLWSTKATRELAEFEGKKIIVNSKACCCGDYIPGKGYVQCNVPIKKDNYHVAFLNKNQKEHEWPAGDATPYNQMRSVLKRDNVSGNQEHPNKNQADHLLKKLEEINKTGGMIPVRYFTVRRGGETLVYMSNSAIGRIAQHRKWKEIIGKNYLPCSDTDKLCPACLLFGTTQGNGLGGRVRVSDASALKAPVMEYRTLEILGEPRTSSFEFYLRRPVKEATYWNFDFYSFSEEVYDGNNKKHTETVFNDLTHATPRGRKYYWHGEPRQTAQKTKLNSTMQCVTAGEFVFKLHYDGITQEQLDTLKWVVTLGDNREGSTLWHKLGHGRPLGYGSVKMVIEGIHERTVNRTGDTITMGITDTTVNSSVPTTRIMAGKETTTYRSIMAMCDAKSVEGLEVRYPRFINKKNTDDIFNWFSNNRTSASKVRILPEPYSKDITLEGSWFNDESRKTERNATVVSNTRTVSVAKEKGKKYDASVIGHGNGRDGIPFYVKVKFEDGDIASIPFFKISKACPNDQVTDRIPVGMKLQLTFDEMRDGNKPNWRKA